MLLAHDLGWTIKPGFTYSWINTTLGYYHYACILLVIQSLSIGIHGTLLSEWKVVAKLVIQAYSQVLGLGRLQGHAVQVANYCHNLLFIATTLVGPVFVLPCIAFHSHYDGCVCYSICSEGKHCPH